MNRREPTVSITVRFPKALAGRLGERAKQDHQSVSTLLRRYAELGLNGEDYARQTDPIRDIICEEITHSVRQQTDRIAAMLNRLTILSASAYYANLAFVTAFVDQDRYTSFEKIERTELTPELVREFVERIEVHERSWRYKKKHYTQQVDIYFNFIGQA